jgi:hypothetical protein
MVNVVSLLSLLALGLGQPPYIGVDCRGAPNVTTCGQIGIAVWLRRPARRVDATISRVHVRLHAGGLGGTGPTYWEGYLHIDRRRLGLPTRWYGTKPVKILTLRLVIRDARGMRKGSVRVRLRPGWG